VEDERATAAGSADEPASLQLLKPNGAAISVGGGRNARTGPRAFLPMLTASFANEPVDADEFHHVLQRMFADILEQKVVGYSRHRVGAHQDVAVARRISFAAWPR
jgi:hypothetical protein